MCTCQIVDTAADSLCFKKGGGGRIKRRRELHPRPCVNVLGVGSVSSTKHHAARSSIYVGTHIKASGSKHGRACSDEGTDTK